MDRTNRHAPVGAAQQHQPTVQEAQIADIIAWALYTANDLRREEEALGAALDHYTDGYLANRAADFHAHVQAACQCLRAMQSHVGQPTPKRLPAIDMADIPTRTLRRTGY